MKRLLPFILLLFSINASADYSFFQRMSRGSAEGEKELIRISDPDDGQGNTTIEAMCNYEASRIGVPYKGTYFWSKERWTHLSEQQTRFYKCNVSPF